MSTTLTVCVCQDFSYRDWIFHHFPSYNTFYFKILLQGSDISPFPILHYTGFDYITTEVGMIHCCNIVEHQVLHTFISPTMYA